MDRRNLFTNEENIALDEYGINILSYIKSEEGSKLSYDDKMLLAFVQDTSKFSFYKDAFEKIKMGRYVWSWYGFFFNTAFLCYRNILSLSTLFANMIIGVTFLNFGTFVNTKFYGSEIFLSICCLLYIYVFGLLPMNLIKNSFDKTKSIIEGSYETEEKRITKMLSVSTPNNNSFVVAVFVVVVILLIVIWAFDNSRAIYKY